MKRTIIVTTDFTASSRNALAYTCGLASNVDLRLLLMHVYTMPVNYTSDGVTVAAIGDAFETAEEKLTDEVQWVKEVYPRIVVEGKALVGGLLETLREELRIEQPETIVMGAVSDFSDLWQWDSELLRVLTQLPVPVLIIPQHIVFKPLRNIGFACDYRNLCLPHQVSFIKTVLEDTHARLHVVHVTRSKQQNDEVRKKNEALLQQLLEDVTPLYYAIEDPNVIDATTKFVKDHDLDLLIVIPHRHDIWYSIFHQSHTRQLARLNNIPILALHD